MFLLKKWPRRLLLLPKLKSDSGSGFHKFMGSGSGSERKMQNPAVVDSGMPDPWPLCSPAYQRWALDRTWIRTIANFVEFGLHPDCKTLQNLGSGPDFDWVNGKEMRHFSCEKAAFFIYFRLHLDLDFVFEKNFGLWLDLDWVLKNQVWIAKYDSPLISAAYHNATIATVCRHHANNREKNLDHFWL